MQFLTAPHLEILSPPQRALWDELRAVPPEFVLYGGTALALRLGHRQSVDFDFFGRRELDPLAFSGRIGFLRNAQVIRHDRNTLSAIVDCGGPVQVSFFGVPSLHRLREPEVVPTNGLQVTSLLDLAGTKASVVQVRGEAKDYLDIDALMSAGIALPHALAGAARAVDLDRLPDIAIETTRGYER